MSCKGRRGHLQGAQWNQALAAVAQAQERRRSQIRPGARARLLKPRAADQLGTDPSQVVGIKRARARCRERARGRPRRNWKAPTTIWASRPARRSSGRPVNRVFIAPAPMRACLTSRPPHAVVRGRRVASGVIAMVVPGSSRVKREAEAKGLDACSAMRALRGANPAASMCAGGNGDRGEPGERVVSTTNRNFREPAGPEGAHASCEARQPRRRPASHRLYHRCAPYCWQEALDAAVQVPYRHRRPV